MANTVKIKQSAVPSRVPTTSDLALGELGVNTYDGKLYTRKDSGTASIIEIGASGGNGTVTTASVVSANGFAGSVATATTTPAITISTSITGILKGNATAISAAVASTDYLVPAGALGTPSSGTLTNCTFPTLNQNTSGTAAGLSATLAVSSGGTSLTTLTANNVILGNGTSAPTFVAPGTSGNLLTSNGTTWQSTAPAAASGTPTGALMPYAGSSAPTGYLLCDGSSVSSTTYLALHAVISNTYGGSAYTGAGALSFNLPDLRGRLPMGAGTGTGLNASGTGAPSGTAQTARTRGQWLGEETHLLTTAELASHTHANTVSGGNTSTAGGSHTHGSGVTGFWVYNSAGAGTIAGGSTYNASAGGSPNTASTNIDHSHTFSPSINNVAAGSGSRHAIIPPVVVLNYIIKT